MTTPLPDDSSRQVNGRISTDIGGPPSESDPNEVLALQLVEELAAAWRAGDQWSAEEVLADHPELWDHPQAALRVVYEEVCLRQEVGQEIDSEEVLARFPQWEAELRALLDCHRLFEPPPAKPMFPRAGETWGDFQLLAELGQGAQGRVFLATQPALADRPVVLKLTPCTGQEHLSLARLQHTGIVPLYFAQDDPARNLRTLCMPYFGGLTLARLLEGFRNQPPERRSGESLVRALDDAQASSPVRLPAKSPARLFLARASYDQAVCFLGACLADALQYAHERGLVHLDVKPSNVLLATDGQPMLLDFHLAQPPLYPDRTTPEWIGGTLAYMPREQQAAMTAVNAGQPIASVVDGRADIFSLGVLLYESLGGRAPYLPGVSPLLHRCNPAVTLGLSDIVHKCLAYHARDRYQDAASLAADLRRHLNDQKLRGVPNRSWRERWHKWRRREPKGLIVTLVLLAALVLIPAGGYYLWKDYSEKNAAAEKRLQIAQDSLRTGKEALEKHSLSRAQDAFRRGRRLLEGNPEADELNRQLAGYLGLAERLMVARELHKHLEEVRSSYGADVLSRLDLRQLEAQCRAIWQRRQALLKATEFKLPEGLEAGLRADWTAADQGLRNDLLDLAVIYSDVPVLLAAPDEAGPARRQALEVLDEAEKLFGPSAVLEWERQCRAGELGDRDLAERAGRRAGELKPRTAWEYWILGRSFLRRERWPEAEAALRQAADLDPKALWSHYYLGVYAYQRGRREQNAEAKRRHFEDAAAAFGVCIALAKERKPAASFFNRAQAYTQLGLTARALHDYRQALEGDINPAAVYYNMAVLHEQRHERTAALECLEKALEHNELHKGAQDLYRRLKR
jgi:serine/threonine protein kinase/Tfp pilus assembly protein PilF